MDIVKVNVAGQCSRFYTTAAMVDIMLSISLLECPSPSAGGG